MLPRLNGLAQAVFVVPVSLINLAFFSPEGRVSAKLTDLATPGPLFVTVMVYASRSGLPAIRVWPVMPMVRSDSVITVSSAPALFGWSVSGLGSAVDEVAVAVLEARAVTMAGTSA